MFELRFDRTRVGSFGELTEQLHERIDDAVRVRMVSDVPLGAFLSGGMAPSLSRKRVKIGCSYFPVRERASALLASREKETGSSIARWRWWKTLMDMCLLWTPSIKGSRNLILS